MRKFEKISYEQFVKDLKGHDNIKEMYDDLILPNRGTKQAAGYDFHSLFPFKLECGEKIKIPTGLKVMMEPDEVLLIVVRSSMGIKHNIRLCNQVGIIDADYYNNKDNEGHLYIVLQNEGKTTWEVSKGDKIGQGVFVKFLTCDDEPKITNERTSDY